MISPSFSPQNFHFKGSLDVETSVKHIKIKRFKDQYPKGPINCKIENCVYHLRESFNRVRFCHGYWIVTLSSINGSDETSRSKSLSLSCDHLI